MGDLAKYPHNQLKKAFGILGTDLHLHANGIDQSKLRDKHHITNPSICKSQILMRDYTFEESKVVMQELIEDVASRVRARNKWQEQFTFHLAIAKVVACISNIHLKIRLT